MLFSKVYYPMHPICLIAAFAILSGCKSSLQTRTAAVSDDSSTDAQSITIASEREKVSTPSFNVSIELSDSFSLTTSMLNTTNADVNSCTNVDNTYSCELTAQKQGEVTAWLDEGDLGLDGEIPSPPSNQLSVTYDALPTATLSVGSSVINTPYFQLTVKTSEPATNITPSSFDLTNAVANNCSAVGANGDEATCNMTATSSGKVIVKLKAGAVKDLQGNSITTLPLEATYVKSLSILSLAPAVMDSFQVDSLNRSIKAENITSGESVSFNLYDDLIPATDLDCPSKPIEVAVSGNSLVINLINKHSAGSLSFECSSFGGSIQVDVSYSASNLSLVGGGYIGWTQSGNAIWKGAGFSFDSKWVAYSASLANPSQIQAQNLETKEIKIISSNNGKREQSGNQSSSDPIFSGDSKYVYFLTASTNLADYAGSDVQLMRKSFIDSTAKVELVSVNSSLEAADQAVSSYTLTKDGKYAYFVTEATNLGYAPAGNSQLYRKDLTNLSLAPTLVSTPDGTTVADGPSSYPQVSSDGIQILFETTAPNLGAATSKQIVRKTSTNLNLPHNVISVNSSEVPGDDDSYDIAISHSGDFVLFETKATNLGGGNPTAQIVKKQLLDLTLPVFVVSVAADGTTKVVGSPAISSFRNIVISPDDSEVYFSYETTADFSASYTYSQTFKKNLNDLNTPPVHISGYFVNGVKTLTGRSVIYDISPDGKHLISRNTLSSKQSRFWDYSLISTDDLTDYQVVGDNFISTMDLPWSSHSIYSSDGNTQYIHNIVHHDLYRSMYFKRSLTGDPHLELILEINYQSSLEGFAVNSDETYLVFSATDKAFGGTGTTRQLYAKSLVTTSAPPFVVSVDASLNESAGDCKQPMFGPDNQSIYFICAATNFPGGSASQQLYKKSITNLSSAPLLISTVSDFTTPSGGVSSYALASDASFAVITSSATNWGAAGAGDTQVFRKNLLNLAETPTMISVLSDGTTKFDGGVSSTYNFKISPNDMWIYFKSDASNLSDSSGSMKNVIKSTNNINHVPLILPTTTFIGDFSFDSSHIFSFSSAGDITKIPVATAEDSATHVSIASLGTSIFLSDINPNGSYLSFSCLLDNANQTCLDGFSLKNSNVYFTNHSIPLELKLD